MRSFQISEANLFHLGTTGLEHTVVWKEEMKKKAEGKELAVE